MKRIIFFRALAFTTIFIAVTLWLLGWPAERMFSPWRYTMQRPSEKSAAIHTVQQSKDADHGQSLQFDAPFQASFGVSFPADMEKGFPHVDIQIEGPRLHLDVEHR
jgi:hypothetical protein